MERGGFDLRQTSGDHARYRHPITRRTAIVPLTRKVLPVGTIANILRQAGLTSDEFRELL